MLYGVWRDRGSLYAHPAQPADANEPTIEGYKIAHRAQTLQIESLQSDVEKLRKTIARVQQALRPSEDA